jgi:hypothetical protein
VQFMWMYSQERELKKLRYTVRNKAWVEGCIVEAFTCKEITNFLSMYLSRANNAVPCSQRCFIERAINFSMEWYRCWTTSAHYVINKE